jgi:hypothetical protein
MALCGGMARQPQCDRGLARQSETVLPNEFLRAVFKKSKLRFYLGRGGWLRSRRHSFWDRALSTIEAFDRFGGDAMEEALERGSFQVIKH